jgi:GT2 family glycosyltransferase
MPTLVSGHESPVATAARAQSGPALDLSVVVVSHNEGQNLPATVKSLLASFPAGGSAEVVVVDDSSTDGSATALEKWDHVRVLHPPARLGAAAARNYGARHSRGETIVFSDAHVTVPWDWIDRLLPLLSRPEVGAVSPAISIMHKEEVKGYGLRWRDLALNVEWLPRRSHDPYPVPILPGGFLAMRRDVFERSGGWDQGLRVWGMDDAELSFRLWTLGYECLLAPTIDVAHLFRKSHIYKVDWEVLLHNTLRLGMVHFGEERNSRLAACLAPNPSFPQAFARLVAGDAWTRREQVRAARLHDDDWYFATFGQAQ